MLRRLPTYTRLLSRCLDDQHSARPDTSDFRIWETEYLSREIKLLGEGLGLIGAHLVLNYDRGIGAWSILSAQPPVGRERVNWSSGK